MTKASLETMGLNSILWQAVCVAKGYYIAYNDSETKPDQTGIGENLQGHHVLIDHQIIKTTEAQK